MVENRFLSRPIWGLIQIFMDFTVTSAAVYYHYKPSAPTEVLK